jgi:toxin HigB-1
VHGRSVADTDLDRLETDAKYTMGLADGVVKAYRKRLQLIRAAADERDFRELKSLHFEKLKGERSISTRCG